MKVRIALMLDGYIVIGETVLQAEHLVAPKFNHLSARLNVDTQRFPDLSGRVEVKVDRIEQ